MENATDDSDYGSDFDSELAIQILSQLEAAPVVSLALESLEDDAPYAASARLPAQLSSRPRKSTAPIEIGYSQSPGNCEKSLEVAGPKLTC